MSLKGTSTSLCFSFQAWQWPEGVPSKHNHHVPSNLSVTPRNYKYRLPTVRRTQASTLYFWSPSISMGPDAHKPGWKVTRFFEFPAQVFSESGTFSTSRHFPIWLKCVLTSVHPHGCTRKKNDRTAIRKGKVGEVGQCYLAVNPNLFFLSLQVGCKPKFIGGHISKGGYHHSLRWTLGNR